MVKLYSQQVGKCGELLVQYILLKHGIESAHLTTDRGIDLVAFDSVKQKPVTIQVKTSTHRVEERDKWLEWLIPTNCPAEYIAAVDLERDKFWLFSTEKFKTSGHRHGDSYILWWYVSEPPQKTGEKHRETSYSEFDMDAIIPKLFHLGEKGAKLCIDERGGDLLLKPITHPHLEKVAGALPTKGKLSKALLRERARDKKREEVI